MLAQPMIAVRDVEAASRWYRRLLGAASAHGGAEYERLVKDGRLLLQLHRWDVHEHPHLGHPQDPHGNGVLLWFETGELDDAVARARELGAEVLEEPHVNPLAQHRECWLRDLDGYAVVLASPHGDTGARSEGVRIDTLCPLIEVFDMPRSLRFYRDVLGFSVVESSGTGDDVGWVRLRHGGAELMLNTAYDEGERPPAEDRARVASHGDTALYLSCQDLDAAHAHLNARGVPAEPPAVAPYGMRQLYVFDPDGYRVCLQWPAGPSSS